MLGLEVLLQAPASSNTRVNAGLWVSAAAVAGNSRDFQAASAASRLHRLYKTRVASELVNDAAGVSRDDSDLNTNLQLLTSALK